MNDQPPPYNPYGQKQHQETGMYSNNAPPGYAYPPPPPPNSGYAYGNHQLPPQPPPVHAGYDNADLEYGGMPKSTELGFSNRSIRQGFIRKVFILLTGQLLFVTALVALFVFEPSVKAWASSRNDSSAMAAYIAAYVIFLVAYIAMVCCSNVRRRFPGNMICLIILTAAMGYMVAMIASFHQVNVVVIALAITVICCTAIIIFSMQTKYDFTGCIAIMFVLTVALIFAGLFILLAAVAFPKTFALLHAVYCGIAAVIFMVWLAIDVQLVMGGKRAEISPEDYVFAATQLFLDIVYIFLYILQIVGYASK